MLPDPADYFRLNCFSLSGRISETQKPTWGAGNRNVSNSTCFCIVSLSLSVQASGLSQLAVPLRGLFILFQELNAVLQASDNNFFDASDSRSVSSKERWRSSAFQIGI